MNGMHDSHKRTSISQLLNPSSDSSAYSHSPHLPSLSSPPGVSPYQHTQHPHHSPYPHHPDTASSFHLRAASWGPVNDDQSGAKRRADAGPPPARPYPMQPHMYPEMNGDMQARQVRPRMDEQGPYPIPGNPWPHPQPEMANIHYGAVVTPMYSDERTAMSGEFVQNNQFAHNTQDQHQQPIPTNPHASARFTAPIPGQPVFEVGALMHPPPPGMFPAMLYPHPPPAVQVQKRPSTEVEEPPSQKPKKARMKSKAADGNASSKRGYNAKKRSEAAQIAQNAQLMPTISYAATPGDKGKEKAGEPATRIITAANGTQIDASSLQPELQFARFQGIRFFLKDSQRNIIGVSFVENLKPDAPNMNFPGQWNVPLTTAHIRRIKRTVAQALLPTLRKELEHLATPEVIRRTRESEVRATCGATQAEIAALQARREKHAHTNPFFLSCTRRNEHVYKDFSPMSRFCKSELAQAIKEMEELLTQPDVDVLPATEAIDPSLQNGQSSIQAVANGGTSDQPVKLSSSDAPAAPTALQTASSIAEALGTEGIPSTTASSNQPSATGSEQAAPSGSPDMPSHPTVTIADSDLTEEVFRPLWAKGEPIVVTGLLPKFQIQWTPEYFIQKYNSQNCLILECQTDFNKRVNDWPPSTDFKSAFPELYEDFSKAVPVPTYVRRDGALNIASHFPSNTVAPDLGPKMYNAMASFESTGSKGSTRLHMDMADALNIMTFAAPTPDGKPGCAVWDLFRASDSEKLRHFLKRKFKGTYQHDPIHSQQFYLDSQLRKDLFDTYGVKSHRVYQRPGEAVFIPAGCAHQEHMFMHIVDHNILVGLRRTQHQLHLSGIKYLRGSSKPRPALARKVHCHYSTMSAPGNRSETAVATTSSWVQSQLTKAFESAGSENELASSVHSALDDAFSSNCEVRKDHAPQDLSALKEELVSRKTGCRNASVKWEQVISTNDDKPDEASPAVVAGHFVVTRYLPFLIRASLAQRLTDVHFSARVEHDPSVQANEAGDRRRFTSFYYTLVDKTPPIHFHVPPVAKADKQ
ncbi:hypothetical protein ID866_2759 [Astraeus odoratus]|nr:hypothetical protein ID866_2759 [Astraeus odoratus]